MVLSMELWESWDDEVQMAYTYYANLKGKDAVVIGKGIGFGLKNAFCQKSDDAYYNSPKINLFVWGISNWKDIHRIILQKAAKTKALSMLGVLLLVAFIFTKLYIDI